MARKNTKTDETPLRAQEIDGPRDHPTAAPRRLRIQSGLPMSFPYFGMTILSAEFRRYPTDLSTWLVEVETTIGVVKGPYLISLTVPQALAADIIEEV